jgi:Flp pilus assembly protein TadG
MIIPSTPEGWLLLIGACFIGFALGQWIRSRRKRKDAHEEAADRIRRDLAYAAKAAGKKKGKKGRRP